MSNKSIMLASAMVAVLAAASQPVLAADAAKEKCYGIAKAAANDCAANGHSCAGQAAKDNDAKEWKYVAKGTCLEMKGTLKAM
ncbi:MAG: BufA1 family periplasmic bufferin-type metallophore [Deefgea sp.]